MTRGQFTNGWLIVATLGACTMGACSNESATDTAANAGPPVNAQEETARLEAELAADATVNAATAASVRPVKPVLKCVDRLSSTSYRAHFSYTNSSSQSIAIPVGFYNRFYPNPTNRGQTTTYAAGTHADVIQITFSSSSLAAWILGSGVALATRSSTLCPTGSGGATGAGGRGGTAGTGAGGVGSGGSGAGGAAHCPSSCDDRNPCTTDLCSASTGFQCSNLPARDGTACDDGNLCTVLDSCLAGACVAGSAKACNALDQCHVAGVCAPATGLCSTPNAPEGTACNDNKVCTTGDACRAGVCTPSVTLTASHCAGSECDQCSFDVGTDLCSLTPEGCNNCIPATDGCDAIADATDRQLCEDVYGCVTNPTLACITQGDARPCWCGTNLATCDTDNAAPTMANGPCLDVVIRAARLTLATYDAVVIQQRLVDPDYPLGRALNLTTCRGIFCSPECGVH